MRGQSHPGVNVNTDWSAKVNLLRAMTDSDISQQLRDEVCRTMLFVMRTSSGGR